MEWVWGWLIVWAAGNLMLLLYMSHELLSDTSEASLWLYPTLMEWCKYYKINKVGRTIIAALFTLLMLPGLIIWYVGVLGVMTLWLIFVLLIQPLFTERRQK